MSPSKGFPAKITARFDITTLLVLQETAARFRSTRQAESPTPVGRFRC
jgi:hypothetical protein